MQEKFQNERKTASQIENKIDRMRRKVKSDRAIIEKKGRDNVGKKVRESYFVLLLTDQSTFGRSVLPRMGCTRLLWP